MFTRMRVSLALTLLVTHSTATAKQGSERIVRRGSTVVRTSTQKELQRGVAFGGRRVTTVSTREELKRIKAGSTQAAPDEVVVLDDELFKITKRRSVETVLESGRIKSRTTTKEEMTPAGKFTRRVERQPGENRKITTEMGPGEQLTITESALRGRGRQPRTWADGTPYPGAQLTVPFRGKPRPLPPWLDAVVETRRYETPAAVRLIADLLEKMHAPRRGELASPKLRRVLRREQRALELTWGKDKVAIAAFDIRYDPGRPARRVYEIQAQHLFQNDGDDRYTVIGFSASGKELYRISRSSNPNPGAFQE